ncbi:glutamate receptor ionotropic, kainate glr-3-like [Panulirus ornatus]|uniref:glutamate receptor ionotropic, kainate glr-3-like n=1 Tax=Panulirus ornatus TaxID=150431 RepID=UPI003A85FFA6
MLDLLHRCSVYIHQPYNPQAAQALLVASWTPYQGLVTHLPLFPDKFSKFPHRPTIVAATEGNPLNKLVLEEEDETPGGGSLTFSGPMPKLMNYLATAINFSYMYVRPPDGTWGLKYDNGSWSGMVGMVSRKEADIGVGPFGVSGTRAEVVDFTLPIMIEYSRMLGARGRPEVDPWGFLLPLAPLVWAAVLVASVVLPMIMTLLSSYFVKNKRKENWSKDFFGFVRILLQQGRSNHECWWWWERLVLGVWMMMTLVLTRSYAGNLMALLAVRYIPKPYQTIGNFLDDPAVTMIWGSGSNIKLYLYVSKIFLLVSITR